MNYVRKWHLVHFNVYSWKNRRKTENYSKYKLISRVCTNKNIEYLACVFDWSKTYLKLMWLGTLE